ncbi:uncharacterized protein LOC115971401 isoform X2 [Quercus lobata]|uniref:Uncharacterized protein n=1 Tax=Quercus lobata TaxID=97700 RepID=A0A7N2REJ8_QUELO|nr:uncharacterized protein LOC115971401 isoform X2 [Quercus lobata]
MVVELCLMASHGYPSGLVLHQEQSRVFKDSQPLLPSCGVRHELIRSRSLTLRPHQCEDPWKSISGSSESNQFVHIDSTVKRPVLIDVQDDHPDSILFSFGIAEQCTKHDKILKFLMSRPSEVERSGLDVSLLSDLMGLQALKTDAYQQPFGPSLIYPSGQLHAPKPILDFVRDLASSSKIVVQPDGRVIFTDTGKEVNDLLSVVAEFYVSRNSSKCGQLSMLVPRYSRLDSYEAVANVHGSSMKPQAITVAPLKSPEKLKVKPSQKKKKNGRKVGRERDLYKKNYFHACECLLSLMAHKRYHGKTAILSLKKSGPELPELLTQFSVGIAGTGLAVLFNVICKVACGRVPFCASRLFSTGVGFGLVWLSWAVNKLRDTIVYISKNASKMGLKEEEMVRQVDKSMHEIYFRAAALMAVTVLKLV